jgi:insulysin
MDWQNFFLGQSYSLSDYFGSYALTDQLWSLEENLKELPCMSLYTLEMSAV